MAGTRIARTIAACLCVVAVLLAPAARAADKIIAGTLGGQAPLWPFYIAINKGFLAAEDIDLELNFAPTSSGIIQQLTAGSLDVVVSVGMTDPMQAIDKGAPLALIRVVGDAAPYALVSKPAIKTIADLRGKIISTGSPVDITSAYFERMMEANGLKKGDYDVIPAGVAAARFAALQAGAADAAMVLPPLNFRAEKAGFVTLGLAADYEKSFPFTGMVVHRRWAAAHMDAGKRLLAATEKSFAWLADDANRAAAVALLVEVGKASPEDAEASYDYLRKIKYFEPTGKMSRHRLKALIDVEKTRGYINSDMTVDRLVMPGLGALSD
jgi:NitT/TauT family transport system substrate-binding protein